MEAKLNAATETLDEKEKQLNETVAQKDTEIYRLSEEVKNYFMSDRVQYMYIKIS